MSHTKHLETLEQRKNIFIINSKNIHGERYDYSKLVYITNRKKVEIVCSEHGSFWQYPFAHSGNQQSGCPTCNWVRSKSPTFPIGQPLTQEGFLSRCLLSHGTQYTYEKTEYTGKNNYVTVTCKIHGDFSQRAGTHLRGSGCSSCGVLTSHKDMSIRSNVHRFIEKSIKAHGDTYDYSKSEYLGRKYPITILCKKHGEFTLLNAQSHYSSATNHFSGCPKCSNNGTSRPEQQLADFVKSLGITILENDRIIIKPQELDIVIPELKIAIEFNGAYWHSEQAGKDKNYHLAKLTKTMEAGYRLIQIFENDWVHKKEIVMNRLRHILSKDTQIRLYARKLIFSVVSAERSEEFFAKYHIQGSGVFEMAYGLLRDDELVACMSFGEAKEKGIELLQYATAYNVVGGFSRLLSNFKKCNPEVKSIISYSDRNWSIGEVYEKNGFKHVERSTPEYFYSDRSRNRISRIDMRSRKLKIYDDSKTETENVIANGYFRIFDSGQDKWELGL